MPTGESVLPDPELLRHDQIGAIERAALSCGRLSATVELSRSALSSFLLVRHAVRVNDGATDLATELLRVGLADTSDSNNNDQYEGASGGRHPSVAAALVDAGFGALLTNRVRAALEQADTVDPRHASGVFRAAIIAGVIVTMAPGDQASQRGAALAGALALVSGGILGAPWLAPYRLDAAARSAAVQVDRSGEWSEWVRAWCVMLARDAASVEKSLRTTESQLDAERAAAREQRRVGATDDAVLRWLHSHATFTIRDASSGLGLTAPTIGTAIERLEAMGVATELTGQKRDRVWTSTTLLGLAAAH